ncbi:tRNA pseudouridine(55) synthase TruB [bacterium]|nr:tRNA pseudouridine(55) synthase TruB [bacterium]
MKESGFIIINKPVGPTSHDIVDMMRKITGIKKIGHAGTLDPFASGVLVLAIGRQATKRIDKIVQKKKEYEADIFLGAVTDTYDGKGKVLEEYKGEKIDKKDVKRILKIFKGKQKQIPPMFSAKKIKGKKLYELARQGKTIEREPNEIKIYKIKLKKYVWPVLKIKIKCSKGTYIRSLAFDIGRKLGSGAYLKELQRISVGKFRLKRSVDIEDINKDNWKIFLCDY